MVNNVLGVSNLVLEFRQTQGIPQICIISEHWLDITEMSFKHGLFYAPR